MIRYIILFLILNLISTKKWCLRRIFGSLPEENHFNSGERFANEKDLTNKLFSLKCIGFRLEIQVWNMYDFTRENEFTLEDQSMQYPTFQNSAVYKLNIQLKENKVHSKKSLIQSIIQMINVDLPLVQLVDLNIENSILHLVRGKKAHHSQIFTISIRSKNLVTKYLHNNRNIELVKQYFKKISSLKFNLIQLSHFIMNILFEGSETIIHKYSSSLVSLDADTGRVCYYGQANKQFHNDCTQVCGDSITWNLPCDNQLNVLYDGCDNHCQVEPNFECDIIGLKSVCSYTGSINMSLVSLSLDQNTGYYKLDLQISPPLHAFSLSSPKELHSMFHIHQNILQHISYDSHSNKFSMTFIPPPQINNHLLTIFYNPQKSPRPEFSKGPTQIFQLTPFPVVIFEYTTVQKQISTVLLFWCYFLMACGWISCVIGFILKKLAGLEAMIVLQFTWLNFLCINSSFILPYESMYPLKFTFGYNHHFTKQNYNISNTPPYTSQFQMSPQLLSNNFNLSLLIITIPFFAMLILLVKFKCYMNSKTLAKLQSIRTARRKTQLKQQYNKLNQKYKFVLQLQMTCTTLIIIQFFSTSALFFRFGTKNDPFSLAIFIIAAIVILFSLLHFHIDPCSFHYFRYCFLPKYMAFNHFSLYILVLVVSTLLLVLAIEVSWLPIIPLFFLSIYSLVYRPYKLLMENIRSAFNLLIMCGFVGFRTSVQYISNVAQLNRPETYGVLIFLVTVCLSVCVIWSFVSSIYLWHSESQANGNNYSIEEGTRNETSIMQQLGIGGLHQLSQINFTSVFQKDQNGNKDIKQQNEKPIYPFMKPKPIIVKQSPNCVELNSQMNKQTKQLYQKVIASIKTGYGLEKRPPLQNQFKRFSDIQKELPNQEEEKIKKKQDNKKEIKKQSALDCIISLKQSQSKEKKHSQKKYFRHLKRSGLQNQQNKSQYLDAYLQIEQKCY